MKSLKHYIYENNFHKSEISEKLVINKNFKEAITKPKNIDELKEYINKQFKSMHDSNTDVLDVSRIEFSLLSNIEKPLYMLFKDSLEDVKKDNNIIVDVSNWDLCDLSRIDCIFFECTFIKKVVGLETWDVSNVKDFAGMFSGCSNLEEVDVSNWKLTKAYTTLAMFYNCFHLKTIKGLDTWSLNGNIDMSNMFFECRHLKNIGDINYWSPSLYNKMFSNCNNQIIPKWYH